ncbi:MAG: polyprenyl synthetase family protein [Spirochaetia bacterium]|nr:polyprenyl synthetase family protein [Spirochaetia bacterium]
MDFKARYEELGRKWEENYTAYLEKTSLKEADPDFQEAVYYSLKAGGKRLRPVMCLEMAEMTGLEFDAAMKLATGIECMHTYSLVHDDLPAMDNDDFRRGIPSSHKKYGEDVAILVGDALQNLSFELIASARGGEHLLHYFCMMTGAAGLISGQYMDMKSTQDAADSFINNMHKRKTGYLIAASIVLPCIFQKPHLDYSGMEDWGIQTGLLFQIVDDILDATSPSEKLGKTAGKDEAQNKLTYIRSYGLEKSGQMAKELAATLSSFPSFQKSIFFKGLPSFILSRNS